MPQPGRIYRPCPQVDRLRLELVHALCESNAVWVVIRVSDCAAVVAVVQKPRTITPRFGKPVTIQPAPKLERISPRSEIPILNR